MRSLVVVLGLVVLAPTVRGDMVAPPPSVIEGRFARASLPWARPGRNFAVVVDTMTVADSLPYNIALATLEETWWMRGDAQPWPDVDIVIYFTTKPNYYYGAFYSPLANDIDGLGYGEGLSASTGSSFPDLFDYSPDTLSGVVVLNDFHQYAEQPWFLPIVVEQELGHKWCCFVRESVGGTSSTELLGRDDSHWSYFLETGGSPMEGNAWSWDGANSFTTTTDSVYASTQGVSPFSELDLYLMGLVPPAEVDPFFVIQNPDVMGQEDLYGEVIHRGSSPQFVGDVTITGTRFDFTVDDVIDRNGPRVPATWDGELRVAFVLVVQPGEDEDPVIRSQFGTIVDRSMSHWFEATGGRSALLNVTTPVAGEAGQACDGAAAGCEEGLDCVTFDGVGVCAAACDGWCGEGNCCVESDASGLRCVTPAVVACEPVGPHGPGERCEDGAPCEGDAICAHDDAYDASWCAPTCAGGCPSGMVCGDVDGEERCRWDGPPPGADGAPCATRDECDGNICMNGLCSSFCDGPEDTCAPGLSCEPTAGPEFICIPAPKTGGGGCAVAGGGSGGALGLLGLLFAFRRRRR